MQRLGATKGIAVLIPDDLCQMRRLTGITAAVDIVVDRRKVDRIPADRCRVRRASAATVAVDTVVDRPRVGPIPAGRCRVRLASAVMVAVDTAVDRTIVDRIPAGRCQVRLANAATVVVDIVVAASQVEVPTQGVPCQARRAEAMEVVARGVDPRTVDRMEEETPVAVPAADLQVAITATTK
jgi:hypothetical protein